MTTSIRLFDTDQPNGFDNLQVDVRRLYETHPLTQKDASRGLWTDRVYSLHAAPYLPLSARRAAWNVLRRTGMDISWFDRFRRYWGRTLGGRPMWGVEDFYFLRNIYRLQFQRSREVPADADATSHLEVWQQPAVLSHLFHSVYKEKLFHQLDTLRLLRHARRPVRRLIEFGCGAAPVCTSLFEFHRPKNMTVYLADIETVSFHYAAWKFAEFPNVQPIPLLPQNDFRLTLDQPVDAICCLAVFEHLNAPIETIKTFHRLLAPGGVLVFDYIKSDAQGLDTTQGLSQRKEVMQYVREHFEVVHGRLDEEESIGLTAAIVK